MLILGNNILVLEKLFVINIYENIFFSALGN